MKKAFLFLAFLAMFNLVTVAQGGRTNIQLTDNSIVKDSAGTVYSAALWKPMLSSGYYSLRAEDPKNPQTAFLLIKLTEEQKKERQRNAPKPRESSFFTTGKSIASFKTTDIKGHKYNLKELKGKVVVINFWFINCQPCRMEIPELNKLVDDYKDSSNVVFLAIATDEKYDLQEFLKNTPFNYDVVDRGRYIANMYGVNSYPTHVVLDKEGKVAYHSTGYSSSAVTWLRKSIDEAVNKQE